ncbi:hypothetical protein BSKO_10089 [Bryopsis sp. KO-2023]|nr:hypothetical protein BSKO_10089 [Bryopsis sp. KO-2023]
MKADSEVRGTNDDAQVSKLSCVELGYFKDDFLKYFVKKPSRRAPLINRGYFSRHAALKELLDQFLALFAERKSPCQILSLGAGFDTTWFNLKANGRAPSRYFEVDFPEVTIQKASIISATPNLRNLVDSGKGKLSGKIEEGQILSEEFCLLPVDLRKLDGFLKQLEEAKFDFSTPTYVLSECVLVYMEPEDSASVINWLGKRLQTAACVVYEQIKPDDAFGQQMVRNLESRGCGLRGLKATPTLEAHKSRFTKNGWSRSDSWDMDTIYSKYLDPKEQARICRIEIFDEFEEWHMIQEHYSVTVGINDAGGLFNSFGFGRD